MRAYGMMARMPPLLSAEEEPLYACAAAAQSELRC